MEPVLWIMILSGMLGTLFGGMIALYVHSKSHQFLGALLSFSSGTLLSIIIFDLIPEALEHSNLLIVGTSVIVGMLLIAIISQLLGHHHHDDHDHEHETDLEEFITMNHGHFHVHQGDLRRAGIVMLVAVGLHNIPSGLAIGAGYAHNQGVGIMLALIISIHNLPEGISMILPLVGSGMKREKALFLIVLTGIPTLVGGVIGFSLASVSSQIISILLSLAAGAMIYVTVKEIIPQARSMNRDNNFMSLALLGSIVGFILIFFTHGNH